jgi:hypothetical protein
MVRKLESDAAPMQRLALASSPSTRGAWKIRQIHQREIPEDEKRAREGGRGEWGEEERLAWAGGGQEAWSEQKKRSRRQGVL